MNGESFKIKAGKLRIKGRYYACENSQYPPVIISHEFGLNMLSTARYAKPVAKAGFNVYIFDFCGSGAGISRGRSSRKMSVLTEVDDLFAVMDYVKARENCESLILGGCSQGGLVTALAAAQRESEVEKIFLVYPAVSIPDDARRGSMLGAEVDPENPPKKFTALGYVRLGAAYVKDALSLEPWKEICAFSKPVLILHGRSDGIVDISYSKKAAQLYENARLSEYKAGRHLFPNPMRTCRAAREIIDFIK